MTSLSKDVGGSTVERVVERVQETTVADAKSRRVGMTPDVLDEQAASAIQQALGTKGAHTLTDDCREIITGLLRSTKNRVVGDHPEAVHDWCDTLALKMGAWITAGFAEHDRGRIRTADRYFFIKDVQFFAYPLLMGSVRPEELVEASMAYSRALDVKDCFEYANLSRAAKRELAEDDRNLHSQYFELPTRAVFDLSDREKERLGVREVSTRLCRSDGSVDLMRKDRSGIDLLRDQFRRRERSLGIPERLYSDYELWWIDHKTVDPYLLKSCIPRYAELGVATQLDGFTDQARGLARILNGTDEDLERLSLKPSDGLGGPGPLAAYYGVGIENHDFHSEISRKRMPLDVAPFYKAALLPLIVSDYDVEDVIEFGLSHGMDPEIFSQGRDGVFETNRFDGWDRLDELD